MPGLRALVLSVAASLTIVIASPAIQSASAHAIIELDGISAVAGQSSVMTLEVQHGCLPSNPTLNVQAWVGKPWRWVAPQPVPGWTATVTRQAKGGWHIDWTNNGEPIPFGTPTFFPIKVGWPKTPGIYGMSVMQLCPDSSYYWNEVFAPATATAPSPPLTPLAQVQVVAKPASADETPRPTRPSSGVEQHAHS